MVCACVLWSETAVMHCEDFAGVGKYEVKARFFAV